MKILLSTFLLSLSIGAYAHCPNVPVCEMKAIDSLLSTTKLTGEELERVNKMRVEGQLLYDEGREREAAKVLKEARKILKEAEESK